MTTTTHYHSCTLCEATCGIAVTVDANRVVDIRGDERDPFSRGYICPKATALADLHHDPDRLRTPLVRHGLEWRAAGWDEAFDLVARRIRDVRTRYGKHALAVYQGNPSAHNLGLVTYGQAFFRGLGTRNLYSATSVDQLPHMLAALQLFGHQLLMPVPDIDRTDLLVCLGGNPAVSNGSIMTAPNVRARLKAIRARGGEVVLVDPRRTETAALAGEHLFIRPGTDALLLLSLVQVLFAEGLVAPGRLTPHLRGLDTLRAAAADYPPERTAPVTGVAAERVTELARRLARTERAAVYGRVGVCTQEFGGLSAWLVVVVNALTGHLDEPGGAMFTTPAIDTLPLAARAGHAGSFGAYRSRARGLPEFGGELPVAVLAEEIETPGEGQVRALITSAGNPVLSAPNGTRLERALTELDFMVAIDPYLNETTRHADVILPPTGPLERSHYELALTNYAVRNVAKYSPAVFPRGREQRHDWEIVLELATRVLGGGAPARFLGGVGPEAMLEIGLRTGPYGLRRLRKGLSLGRLKREPHGVDLGPLERRLPGRLATRDRTVDLAPRVYLDDLPRLRRLLDRAPRRDELVLIGRRQLRSNNSWLHNSERLVKGKPRCTLLVHPDDARRHGVADGQPATLSSATGSIRVPVEVTDAIMPGVVSLPHGWGHHRRGTRLRVAAEHAGVSVNDVTDEGFVDELTGTAALSGLRVRLAP
ncbi:Anaerobic selenocysteine-containing dehydrogenase [Amycolatopsis arida]|uniref:Anaerobic selenocysteine-containing dehydrogenase n=1 Tax=Amycolatopsis arida TaxID=587909 RepID=A0A1I5TZT5_9PSEU|nr:molybdopterin-dependent oxidoreductase [Amycolatopsis arida]TDX95886.1 anaerobic selenocysteine-containing dehydrogenase [Amycolatopsis arida]SFP88565.1 Anaerobic selenocysteine-containing dehydrogenase [Amycolatopsis arida]